MPQMPGYNPNAYEPTQGVEPVPAGDYNVAIIDTQIKDTSSGQGRYLEITMKITSGEYTGNLLWERLNLWNQNVKTVEIANGRLSAICHAINLLTEFNNSDVMHGKQMRVRVQYLPNPDSKYGPQNKITSYKKSDSNEPNSASDPNQADFFSKGNEQQSQSQANSAWDYQQQKEQQKPEQNKDDEMPAWMSD